MIYEEQTIRKNITVMIYLVKKLNTYKLMIIHFTNITKLLSLHQPFLNALVYYNEYKYFCYCE